MQEENTPYEKLILYRLDQLQHILSEHRDNFKEIHKELSKKIDDQYLRIFNNEKTIVEIKTDIATKAKFWGIIWGAISGLTIAVITKLTNFFN